MNKKQKMFGALLLGSLVTAAPLAQANDNEKAFLAAEAGDYTTATKTWGALADAGNAEAQFNLALMYHSGAGGDANESEAVKWYQKSAQSGYPKAQEFLAVAYREGWFGLPRDKQQADYWQKQIELNR